MVRSIMFFFIAMLSQYVMAQKALPDQLKVMSFNIRMDSPSDGINQWSLRKEWVAEIVAINDTDIVGMQEVTYPQVTDLQKLLPQYDYIGEGREGGKKGEFSPIFYLRDRFKVIDSGTFWLSEETTVRNSKSWDSSLPRIATWAKFEDVVSKQIVFHVNTHFDHKGKLAREKSIEVIEKELSKLVNGETVVLTGDLNLPPEDEPYKKLLGLGFLDTQEIAPYKSELGYTFNAWKIEAPKTARIDYVFVRGNELSPLKYQELDIQRGPRFASDHYPVLVTFRWVPKVVVAVKSPETIRLLNYNVHHFVAANDVYQRVDINSLVAVIDEHEIDILTLQELDVRTARSGEYLDQVKTLAQRSNMHYSFGKTIDHDGGEYGIAILSRYPILSEHYYQLPKGIKTEEARGLLVNQLKLSQGLLTVGTTHLASNSEHSRTLQAKEINSILMDKSIDLLAGDFNAVKPSETINELMINFTFEKKFDDQLTIPILNSVKKIDFIVAHKEAKISVIDQYVFPFNGLSDHSALVVDFVVN